MTQERFDGVEPDKSSGDGVSTQNINHELRTFLHSIIGYIELLQEEAESQGHISLAPDLEKILLASNHLAALVEERLPDTESAFTQMNLEPTSTSREDAGKWLRDRIFAPNQEQRG